MILLAIDTTGPDCSVALRVPGREDVCVSDAIGRGHAEYLAPMVDRVLGEAGVAPALIERVGVTIGPGSFAGTRVAVAFARGLALAVSAKAVGVSNLAAIAATAGGDAPLGVLHDAKRGEVILQAFGGRDAGAPQRCTPDEAANTLAGLGPDCRVAGSAAGFAAFAGFAQTGIEQFSLPVLLDLVTAADPATARPSPFYARPPDAKLPAAS